LPSSFTRYSARGPVGGATATSSTVSSSSSTSTSASCGFGAFFFEGVWRLLPSRLPSTSAYLPSGPIDAAVYPRQHLYSPPVARIRHASPPFCTITHCESCDHSTTTPFWITLRREPTPSSANTISTSPGCL